MPKSAKTAAVGPRIEAVRGKLSRRAFAARIGMPSAATSLVRYESGEREPPADLIAAIVRALDVDPRWLLTGDGPVPVSVADAPLVPSAAPAVEDDVVRVPLMAPRVGAGEGDDAEDAVLGHFAIDAQVVAPLRYPRSSLRAAVVRGDSMEPALSDGDVVLVARDSAARDAICVVVVDGDVRVKRVQSLGPESMRLVSENPRYAPREVGPADDVRVIGPVVWRGQTGAR
jgi:phage repressor protein C with HTH and peptisase S24 domain